MTKWTSMNDKSAWLNSANKVEILREDGSITKLVLVEKNHKDGSKETRFFCDDEFFNSNKKWTYWRPLK